MALRITKQFKRAIQDDPANCVLLVGAGLSVTGVRTGGKGMPDWPTLMKHMIDELKESGSLDSPELARLRKAVKEGKYLEVAAEYRRHTRSDQFAGFLRSELDPQDLADSDLHSTILRIGFRAVLTTNFDMVFEHHSNRLQPLVYPQCLEDPDAFRRHGFFAKIHGCIRTTPNPAQNLILTEESYLSLRHNPRYQMILRSVLVLNPLLTVGFSLKDPDFLGVMDDLREVFADSMPTVYALMHDPGRKARDEWRARGVEVLAYQDHAEVSGFFGELLRLGQPRLQTGPTAPASTVPEIDHASFAERWRKAQKVEEMNQIVVEQLGSLPSEADREAFLFRLLAFVDEDDELQLAPHFLAIKSPHGSEVVLAMLERADAESTYGLPKPHALHLELHAWVLQHWREFADSDYDTNTTRATWFAWLLQKEWGEVGIDLRKTYRALLDTVMQAREKHGLMDLYSACDEVTGAKEEIEKTVSASTFSEKGLTERVTKEKFLRDTPYANTQGIERLCQRLADAANLDAARPDRSWDTYTELVAERLIEPYAHVTFLSVHGWGPYDPEKGRRILDALAGVRGRGPQLSVLRAIDKRDWDGPRHGPEREMEGSQIRDGLFVPLWWRYASETRVEYLEHYAHGRGRMMEGGTKKTGQEFLLEELMGLTYDVDDEFREAFDLAREQYLRKGNTDDTDKYDPSQLRESWVDKELTYRMCDDTPPDLIRRAAYERRSQPDAGDDAGVAQAKLYAERAMADGVLGQLVSREQRNYVIDNLLGSYVPSKTDVVLYPKMIKLAASDLRLTADALGTIVYIHETVHAFSHIGKDRDGREWLDYAPPPRSRQDMEPSRMHEAIAQFYTFKLIERLEDRVLSHAFEVLEQSCSQVYREWRSVQDYSLEQMREVLVRLRRRSFDWPPIQTL